MASAVSGVFICVGILPLVFITAQNIDSISVADFRPVDNLNDEIFMMRQANTDQSTIVPENSAAYIESSNIAGIIAPRSESILPSTMYDFDNYLRDLNASVDGFWGTGPQTDADTRTGREKRHAKMLDMHSSKIRNRPEHYEHPKPVKDRILPPPTTTKRPAIMPEHMNPGVIFRVRMSDAILRIKQRMYDDPEAHIESDIIYTNLIKKCVADEIMKFQNFLLVYKTDKSAKEHVGECGGRIYKFITFTTIKVNIFCLFDSLWIDGIPYVIGDDYSVTPLDMPPQLQCDAAECSTISYVDSFGGPADLEE